MVFVPSDVRFAVRSLLRTPVLFATAVLTLAAGTGLATGAFALAYGLLLRPLPYGEPSIIVKPFGHQPNICRRGVIRSDR
jgi:hypothetical protein